LRREGEGEADPGAGARADEGLTPPAAFSPRISPPRRQDAKEKKDKANLSLPLASWRLGGYSSCPVVAEPLLGEQERHLGEQERLIGEQERHLDEQERHLDEQERHLDEQERH